MGYSGWRRGAVAFTAMVEETLSGGADRLHLPLVFRHLHGRPENCPSCGAALAADPTTDPSLPGPDRHRRRGHRPRQGSRPRGRATGSCRGSAASTPTRPATAGRRRRARPAGPGRPARDPAARARGGGREPPGRGRRAPRRGDGRGPCPGRVAPRTRPRPRPSSSEIEAVAAELGRGRARTLDETLPPSAADRDRRRGRADGPPPPSRAAAAGRRPTAAGATDEAAPPGLIRPGRAILAAVPDRLPPPGPSFLREHEVRIGDRTLPRRHGPPSDAPDGWWLTLLWVADDEGVVSFRDVAPAAGPPPDPPLARLGPALAGALSGLHPRGRRPAPAPRRRPRAAGRPDPPVARAPRRPRRVPVRAGARRGDAPERARRHRAGRFRRAVEGLARP